MLETLIYNPIINYLIKLIIYGQIPFFMWLYESDLNINKFADVFLYSMLIPIPLVIYILGFSFHYYNTQLIITYIYLIIFAYSYLRVFACYDFKHALSISFLLVILNSFYWELVLHLAAAHQNIYALINPRESIRLIIVPFLLHHYKFHKHKANKYLRLGIIVSGIIAYFRLKTFRINGVRIIMFSVPLFGNIGKLLYTINRIFCLWILLKIITECGTLKKGVKKWFQ